MARRGLYANIHAKRKRGGKMRKKGAKGAPSAAQMKRAKGEEVLNFKEHSKLNTWGEVIQEAEYQGRKVELNNPTQGDTKKYKVYVKNDKGNVVKVNFGQGGDAKGGTMRIRKSNPKARKSFRARHNCDSPGPRHKARYWSCRKW